MLSESYFFQLKFAYNDFYFFFDRRTKREGTKEDPFNRRKTNPKLSVSKARVGDADDEEMTSEKLMQLELEKKKEKESKIQALKDQEENELVRKFLCSGNFVNGRVLI